MTTKKEHKKKRTRKNKNMSGGGGNRGKKPSFFRLFKPKQPKQPLQLSAPKQPTEPPTTKQQERNKRIQKMIENAEQAFAKNKSRNEITTEPSKTRPKNNLAEFIRSIEEDYAAKRRAEIRKDINNNAAQLIAAGMDPRFA
jgi:hypothetical protein